MSSAGDGATGDDGDGISRRTLVRVLIGLGIGVPILVEGLTFLGLVGTRLEGENGEGGDGTETPGVERVGTGEELLPATDASDTLVESTLLAREDAWKLAITVEVDNTTEMSYRFRLGDIVLTSGKHVTGGGETDPLAPGEKTVVTGRWDLPPGSTPDAVEVTGVVGGEETTRTVRLRKIPVQGS
ncbi:MAG: hypothetical protein ABEJ22_08435 [Haloferacaceae archaeon]